MVGALPLLFACVEAFQLESPFGYSAKPYPQEAVDDRNLLKYTSNAGPYSDRRGYGINRDAPAGCEVEQVIMLSRHGERWPSPGANKHINKAVEKVLRHKGKLSGPLQFANYWEPLASNDDGYLGEESLYGPYSGLLDAYNLGAQYRRRYGHLFDGDTQLPLFVSAFQRDADTAKKFGEGFLQWNYTELAAVNLILEENGADTLAPYCKLKNGTTKTSYCPDFDYYTEFEDAAKRLNKVSGVDLQLTAKDVFELINLVGYELNVRGSSPWANVFTSEEWVAYEYYSTSAVYCSDGAGSITGPIAGSLFLNASRKLLVDGPEKSKLPLAFSWAHDTNLVQLVGAMKVDAPARPEDWDPTETRFNQKFDLTDIVPQGGHIVFERLVCTPDDDDYEPRYINTYPGSFNYSLNATANATHTNFSTNSTKAANNKIFVRLVINEAVVPLDGCSNGPGKSCPLDKYDIWVDEKLKGLDFASQCQLEKDAPTELSFFWNFTLSTKLNAMGPYLPAQATELDAEGNPIRNS